jgi:hypothetical protein
MFLWSCNGSKRKDTGGSEVLNIEAISASFSFNDYFKLSSVIKLETNDQCIISDIVKVYISNDGVFIQDGSKRILQFSQSGSFIRSFNHLGKGPGEWNEIRDFDICSTSSEITIRSQKKELVYTINDKFVNEKSVDISAFSFYRIDEDTKAIYTNSRSNDKNSIYKIVISNEKTGNRYFNKSIPCLQNRFYKSENSRNFCQTKNGVYFAETFNDTIYKIDSLANFYPKYIVNFGSKRFPIERINDLSQVEKYKDNCASYISHIYDNDDFFFFQYIDSRPTHILLNKTNNVLFKANLTLDTVNKIPLEFSNYYGIVEDVLCILEPSDYFYYILDNDDIKSKSVVPEFTGMKETDNPLLVFYSLNPNN